MNYIEQLVINQNFEHNVPQENTSQMNIKCIVYLPDPDHPTTPQVISHNVVVGPKQTVPGLIKQVKNELRKHTFGEDTYIKYQHRLYKEGELSAIHVTNNQTIEVISLDTEKEATRNEGFIFAFWSLVPLMVSISFIVPSLIGTFDIVYRGLFMLVGTTIGIPASIFFIIGLAETLTVKMRISFVNYTWFGPCCDCSCCDCCECCHSSFCCCGCNQQEEIEDEEYVQNGNSTKKDFRDNEKLINPNQEDGDIPDGL